MEKKDQGVQFEDPFAWYEFKNYLINDGRYVLSEKMRGFLNAVVEGAKKRIKECPKGHVFYRARLGHQDLKTVRDRVLPLRPHEGKDIGIPPFDKRKSGRSNPSGIGYLYLATDKETAIAEVKPYKGGLVSVACFESNEAIELVDFSSSVSKGFFLSAGGAYAFQQMGATDPVLLEKIIWEQMNFDFAKPVPNGGSDLEYIPTQVIAECLKENGFKGIIYNSALTWTEGDNIVLFDDSLVKEKSGVSDLVEIGQIQLEIRKYEWDMGKRIKKLLDEIK